MLDDNRAFLSSKQTNDLIGKLSDGGKARLIGAVWEVAVLYALSKYGRVEYEKEGLGRSKPDTYFVPKANCDVNFIADITTVSDHDYLQKNLGNELESLLLRKIDEERLPKGGYNLSIGWLDVDRSEPNWYKDKRRLKIPCDVAKLESAVINRDFYDFAARLKENPRRSDMYSVESRETSISLAYDPRELGFGSSGPAYRIAQAITNNPIYSRLSDKVRQIKKADSYNGPKGIVLCDGGSNLFGTVSPLNFNAGQIIREFLRRDDTLDFVVAITSRSSPSLMGRFSWNRAIEVNCYGNSTFSTLDSALRDSISSLHGSLPEPVSDSENARLGAEDHQNAQTGQSFRGGIEWSSYANGVKMIISARVLLDYLAGRIDHKQFLDYSGLDEMADIVGDNPLHRCIERGELISDASFERGESERDDDWVTFVLKGPDPAISRFR